MLGSHHGLAKLAESDILGIRQCLSEGATHKAIGMLYDVHRRTITDIHLRKTWGHV